MRTTITLDDELVKRAKELSGIDETSALIRTALTSLVQKESARRLAALGGTMPDIQYVRRRRPDDPE
jgi:Arc/MetJ family transcription regulator